MIALLLLMSPPPVPTTEQARFEACVELTRTAPDKALAEAGAWRLAGGGVQARHCEALALVAQQRWKAAATAFEQAARAAETARDGRAALFWVQGGNAALAGSDYAGARRMLDAALARGELAGEQLGEAHLDRGRAAAAMGDMKGARADLDLAIRHVPADPLGWLLSATLARRMGDLARAEADIGEALKRSPDDSSVALEAGNIALSAGRTDAARTAFEAATRLQPGSPAAGSAAEALKQLP